MQLHHIKPQHKNKSSKRVGRGGKKGTYSGRGVKGQKCRAGRKMPPAMREVFKRFHKLRGYRQILKGQAKVSLTTDVLEKRFDKDSVISPLVLLEKGIIRNVKGRLPEVKIIARGVLTKKFFINGCCFSQRARKAVENAGGSIR